MQALHTLIHSLTPNETELVKKFLTCFASREGEDNIQSLRLFEYLLNRKKIPDEEYCCIHVYGTPKKEETFIVLKHRLKEKILDLLLTDISSDKQKELDEMDLAIIKMQKKSAQFQQLYYSKKRIPLLYVLLDEIIDMAKKYERYAMLVEHLRHKKNLVSFKQGKKEFEKINKEMEYYLKCSILYNKAEHYYYKLGMLSIYSGKPDDNYKLSFLEKAIAEIAEENKEIKSPHVSYSLKFLELEFYQMKENYFKARSVCMELLKIVLSNKSVYRRQRLGVVHDNLSRCELYLALSKQSSYKSVEAAEHFEHALTSAREAQKYFNLNSENYCIALEQEFYAEFYHPSPPLPKGEGAECTTLSPFGGEMERGCGAVSISRKMISSASRKELGEFRYAKYNYLLANALFQSGRFTESLDILSEEREIASDKSGWETGARILTIMALIEMRRHDEASLAVHALKRFFIRIEKESGEIETGITSVSARDKKILNLLQQAERKGFAFHLLNGTAEKNISMLSSPCLQREKAESAALPSSPPSGELEGALSWQPFTPELIPFHEWFEGKMNSGTESGENKAREKKKEVAHSRKKFLFLFINSE